MFTVNLIIEDDVLATTGMSQQQLDSVVSGIQQATELWARYIDGNNAVIDIALNFEDLSGNTLAEAGASFFNRSPGTPIEGEVTNELNGQAGVFDQDGTFTVDLSSLLNNRFFFSNSLDFEQNPGGFGQIDFLTLAAHELGHVFGFTGLAFEGLVVNNQFVGANAMAANGGNPVQLADGVHIQGDDLLSPFISSNLREPINALHLAILQDIGVPINQASVDADILYGFNVTNDTIDGGAGADQLFGLTGNDILKGGIGNDQLFGGEGNDTIFGEAGNDDVNGDNGDDILFGQAGEDTLSGGLGNDIILGGAENDILFGNDGVDQLFGEAGDDTLDGGGEDDLIIAGLGDDVVFGGDGTDSTFGEAGDDTIDGQTGGDVSFGQEGNDTLIGGAGGDFLFGGLGEDILRGGTENDILAGNEAVVGNGEGTRDVFEFETNFGFDAILDYEVGIDQISFSGITGLNDFSDLTIVDSGGNAVAIFGNDAINFFSVSVDDLNSNQDDFLFS